MRAHQAVIAGLRDEPGLFSGFSVTNGPDTIFFYYCGHYAGAIRATVDYIKFIYARSGHVFNDTILPYEDPGFIEKLARLLADYAKQLARVDWEAEAVSCSGGSDL